MSSQGLTKAYSTIHLYPGCTSIFFFIFIFIHFIHGHTVEAVLSNVMSLPQIRESVDSLCRDGANTDTPIYQMKRLIAPERYSYKPFQTYNKALRVFLYHIRPSKYVKCTDTMTYGNCHTSVFEYFSSSSSSSSNGLPQN